MYRSLIGLSLLFLAEGSSANDNITINMLANNSSTQNCFHQMVKANQLPTWVIRNASNYPTLEMTIREEHYYVMKACNPDDCEREKIVIAYSPLRNILSGVFAFTETPEQQQLKWLGISDELPDGKALLFAELSGSLEKLRENFTSMNIMPQKAEE